MAPYVRQMTPDDLDAAATLLTEAYGRPDPWRDEVEYYLTLQRDGWFVASIDGDIIGMGGAHDYGPFASIGLMATHPSAQRRGVARMILDRVISWLRDRSCQVAVLDASIAGAPLYERYGFLDDGLTALFRRDIPDPTSAIPDGVTPMRQSDVAQVASFDAPLFGANRVNVLESMLSLAPDRAFLVRDRSGNLTGYLFAQAQRLGPWMATTPGAANNLLTAALTLPFDESPGVLVPSANLSATPLLEARGFTLQRALRHMYLGPAAPLQDRARVYGQTSFAIG
jgi:GNAT superfamily N-acetyltransferase